MAALFLTACGSEETTSKTFNFTVEEFESRLSEALKQIGDDTNLKIISSEEDEDGGQTIRLSDNIYIFIDKDINGKITHVSLTTTSNAYFTEKKDLDLAFLLLVGNVDDTLSFGDRNKLIANLGLTDKNINIIDYTKVYNQNNIQYTYKGDLKEDAAIILQAAIN